MSKTQPELQKHTLNFFAGDVDKLRRYYPDIEVSILIRQIVHDFITRTEQGMPLPPEVRGVEIKLPGIEQ